MPLVDWECALGDAPSVSLPAAATVAIAPLDDSVDTNHVTITGNGTIASLGPGPLITKQITFVPDAGLTIVLTNSLSLQLLGSVDRTIGTKSFGTYICDGNGNWTEELFVNAADPGGGGGGGGGATGPVGTIASLSCTVTPTNITANVIGNATPVIKTT